MRSGPNIYWSFLGEKKDPKAKKAESQFRKLNVKEKKSPKKKEDSKETKSAFTPPTLSLLPPKKKEPKGKAKNASKGRKKPLIFKKSNKGIIDKDGNVIDGTSYYYL